MTDNHASVNPLNFVRLGKLRLLSNITGFRTYVAINDFRYDFYPFATKTL